MSLKNPPIWAGSAHDRDSAIHSSTLVGGDLSHGQQPENHSGMHMAVDQGFQVVQQEGTQPGDSMPTRPEPIPLRNAGSPHALEPELGLPTHAIPLHDRSGSIPIQGLTTQQVVQYGHAPGLSHDLEEIINEHELGEGLHAQVPPTMQVRGGSPVREEPEGPGGSIIAGLPAHAEGSIHALVPQSGNDPSSLAYDWSTEESSRYGAYRSPNKNTLRKQVENLASENAHLKNTFFFK